MNTENTDKGSKSKEKKAVHRGRDVADGKWRQQNATRNDSVESTESKEGPQLSKGIYKGRMSSSNICRKRKSLSQGNSNDVR